MCDSVTHQDHRDHDFLIPAVRYQGQIFHVCGGESRRTEVRVNTPEAGEDCHTADGGRCTEAHHSVRLPSLATCYCHWCRYVSVTVTLYWGTPPPTMLSNIVIYRIQVCFIDLMCF